jgi:hypothetical protein
MKRPITDFVFTEHARLEMARRGIAEQDVRDLLAAPQQVEFVRNGRIVCQSLQGSGETSEAYLLRVFVDVDRIPARIVTVYRTSKVKKYWRREQ